MNRASRKRSKRRLSARGTADIARGTEETNSRLGINIKALRVIKGLKLRELAARVGRTESMMSKIENGVALPSVTVLHSIVSALNTSIAALYTEGRGNHGIVARNGKRPSFVIDKAGSKLERLIPSDAGHLLEGNLHILAPGGGSEGLLTHVGEEVGFVVDGELELVVGEDKYRLGVGDSFVFRSETPHSYRNPGKTPAKVIWVSTPPTF
jgi:transcriptional regulator with XRE-family HTH domain